MNEHEMGGWNEWARHILKTLEDNAKEIKDLSQKISNLEIAVGKLQTQAGIYGTGAALVVTFVMRFLFHI